MSAKIYLVFDLKYKKGQERSAIKNQDYRQKDKAPGNTFKRNICLRKPKTNFL